MALSGKDLRAWRGDSGLTQAEAAKAAGVSQEMWSMMESGRRLVPSEFKLPARAPAASGSHRRGPYKD